MWGSEIIRKVTQSIFGGVNKVVQTFRGSKKERDQQGHDEFLNTQNAFSSEFHQRNNRTLWDSFWDGLNRMPRPLFVILIVGYFLLSYIDPEEFQVLNIGLSTVPEKMWYVLSAIIGFYFCARELHKIRQSKSMAMNQSQFEEMMYKIDLIRERKKEKGNKEKPLTGINNASIEAWMEKKKS